MRIFFRKILLFNIGLALIYTILFLSYNAYLNNSFKKKGIFIWGDSQAYQGIDLKELSNTIGKKVFTSAHHGAGVYDFLLFTEQVPKSSEVIISVSKLVQVRKKENDYNSSGLSLWALKQLYENNYSLKEITSILKLNIKPKNNISESTSLYNYSDSTQIGLSLYHFKNHYKKIPSFFYDKQNLYLIGIRNLIKKKCKITFIEFPYHKELVNIENKSPIKGKTDNFKHQIGSLFKDYAIDTIKLEEDKNIFKDLSHLNCLGAKDLSRKLGKKIIKHKHTIIYICNGGGSSVY